MAEKTKSAVTSAGAKSSSKNNAKKSPRGNAGRAAAKTQPMRREIGAFVCLFLGLFSVIGLFGVDALFISAFCGFIKSLIGWGFFLFPPAIFFASYILAFHRGRPVIVRVICIFLFPMIFGAFTHLLFCKLELSFISGFMGLLFESGAELLSGGALSGLIGMLLESVFSVFGAFPLLLFALLFLAKVSFNIKINKIVEYLRSRPKLEYEPAPEPEPSFKPAQTREAAKPLGWRKKRAIDIPMDEEENSITFEDVPVERAGFFNSRPSVKTPDQFVAQVREETSDDDRDDDDLLGESLIKPLPIDEPPAVKVEPPVEAEFSDIPQISRIPDNSAEKLDLRVEEFPSLREAKRVPKEPEKPFAKLSRSTVAAESESIAKAIDEAAMEVAPAYEFPPLSLLHSGGAAVVDGREEMALNRERLESTIISFGVNASISNITRGPTVTRYDLELDAGVKLAKLTNLAGDLALSLGVPSVRIAPIPDKVSTVGVEVPNKLISTVYLRDIIDSHNFRDAQSRLSFAIGKDIGGNCVVGNIAKLPHMLIAGTTGSGKSVCMNSLILSLLYKATPDEARLIMIDPKMVELGIYNGIPHLYIPVVTDPKKAAGALQWSVVEMLKRYRLFSEVGVRDLAGFNSQRRKAGETPLPQVVIVIDELADLMLVASKEVEESICRVAQMGRASGMHLIIATQRPSADVITGLMKANIPSRIAFAVSSAMESRIILDTQGAEKLIGSGDMLYSPLGSGKPRRIQGAFVTDDEREDVINFIKQRSAANYSEEIMSQIDKVSDEKGKDTASSGKSEATDPASNYDELLPQAVDVIFETKQASVSMLQRRLKLGYSRAARLVDQMEEIGVVGPFEGSKPRQILISPQQWQEIQSGGSAEPADNSDEITFAEYEDEPEETWSEA